MIGNIRSNDTVGKTLEDKSLLSSLCFLISLCREEKSFVFTRNLLFLSRLLDSSLSFYYFLLLIIYSFTQYFLILKHLSNILLTYSHIFLIYSTLIHTQ